MLKGMLCATLLPAASLELARHGVLSQAFCGWGGRSPAYHAATFLLSWVAADLFEFSYHRYCSVGTALAVLHPSLQSGPH